MASNTVSLSDTGSSNWQSYQQQIQGTTAMQTKSIAQLNMKNKELEEKQMIQINQMKEIQDKEKLLLTRSRMLQISQDRNSYKKKIIYSLLAVIFAIFILALVLYVLFTRKAASIPTNARVNMNPK